MLKENMHLGMKIARRESRSRGAGDKYTQEELNAPFDGQPWYIVRFLERQSDEIDRAKQKGTDPKEYCVINRQDLTKKNDDYREGNYAHTGILEPYDLVIKKGGN